MGFFQASLFIKLIGLPNWTLVESVPLVCHGLPTWGVCVVLRFPRKSLVTQHFTIDVQDLMRSQSLLEGLLSL